MVQKPEMLTIQEAIIGEVLEDIGRKIGRGNGENVGTGNDPQRRKGAGSGGARGSGGAMRAMALNAARVPQSVVKRVALGGTHNLRELKRQMTYIVRDEANVASWANQVGIDRTFPEEKIDRIAENWSSAWVGSPKRGHTDHFILSFPKGTEAELAEAIARDWGQEVFGGQWAKWVSWHHRSPWSAVWRLAERPSGGLPLESRRVTRALGPSR